MPVMNSFDSTMVMLAEALSFPNLLITLHIYSPESARDALLIRSSDFPGFFCILMFSGLFLRFSSFPFLNHLNLSEEYSELVSHRSTSLEPAADSWLFISFNLGGSAGLGSPSAGPGFPRDPRSFFLPFPLPLPSLRSDISPKMSALRGPGWVTVTRDKFGPRACRKVCPRRGRASGRAAREASPVACRKQRGLDHLERPLSLEWLGAALVSRVPPLPALEWPRFGGLSRSLTARRGKGDHNPVCARISRQLRPLRCARLLLPARSGVPCLKG